MVLKTPVKRKHHEMEAPPEEQEDENAEDLEWYDNEGTTVDGIYIPPAAKPACSFDSKGPRLIITKIVNNFFKSYAGEQTLGPFHKCFNAIVGPNGSGKSNVIDSMLFVFGYRATKIRSKKVSVLLHSSAKYQNVQSCKVSVHFCEIIDKPGDDYDILPNSGFVVSRIANKDNSSYYELNGRRVQFKEVAMLLRKHGVDLDHNRFLILQGEVEQIAMMKCKGENENETGMLEYLEDIIGTSRYKQPLLKLNERVEVLSEQRIEKVNRLKLVSKVLEDLTEPMKEAVNFLKTENTVVYCKNILYQKNIYDLEKKIKDTEEEKSKIDEVQSGLMEKLNALAAEKSEKDKILKHESAKYEHLQKKKDSLKETFDKANNKDIQLQSDMTQLNTNRKKTKELLAEERKKLAELELVPEKSAKGIEECEAKEKELLAKKEVLEQEKVKQLASLRLETQELQQRKEVIQTELLELNKAVVVTKKAYSLAESELKIYVSNEENERKKYEQLKEAFEEVQKTLQEREEAVSQLKNQLPLTRQSLNSALQELNEVRDQESKLQNECRRKRMSLEESKSSMQASRSRGKVLDALMQQKRQGNCPGLFGRLGDLGAINQKYDVAISTACGPLDNMVVDTVSTGEWCIEFLKKYNVGRATFICLDKQEHLRNLANSKIRTPENVHRLYDLITVEDDRIRTAFYYALRDTLVADDLEQATRIAYGAQRFRVVTLQGAVIETSGTMSGGGKTVSRGRMGQKVATSNVDPKVLESLESEVNNFEENIRNLQQKQGGLENQVNALQPQLRKMETDYEKFIAEIQSLQKQKPTLEHQLKSQATISKKTKANPEQVKNLEAAVMKMKTEYEAALANTVDLQTEVDALTKEIKDKTFGKIKNLDKNLNEVSKTIDKCKAEITRLRVAVTTSKRNYKKSADRVATMEQDIVNYETKLREMKALREEIEGDAEKLLACIKEIEEKLVEGQEEYSDIKEAVNKLTKEENKLKGEKVEVDHKIKTFEKKLKELNASIHQWHVKVSQLKLQDVCNEQVEPLKQLTVEELENKNIEAVEKELLNAEAQLKLAKPNLNAIQEYQRQKATFVERSEELDEITNRRARMRELYDGLRSRRKEEFTTGYNIIRLKLKEMYQMITLGGDADFEMMDSFDPFTEGIQLNVRPPKKSWKVISNLSGGEKTLSSLALVFALHYYRPSPLYVMDEIDAALDFKNVSIVGHYIKERTKNAQFIIISLRSNMFELCDNLVGIYKTYECTQSITIDPRIYDQSNTDGSRHNQEEAIGLQDVNTPEHNVTDNTCQNAARSQNTINNGEGLVDSNPTEENQNEDEVPSTEDVNMINLENNSMTSSNSEPKLNSDNDKTIDDSLDEAMECD